MSTTVLDRPAPVAVPAPDPVAVPQERMSALMRQGAQMHPQGYGALYRWGRTCALGAVAMAILGPHGEYYLGDPTASLPCALSRLVRERTGVDLGMTVRMPGHLCFESLSAAIMRLNDQAHWSREQIAQWLEEELGL